MHLMEIPVEELSVEEKETLEGCNLLQSIVTDLDHNLLQFSSLSSYEEHLSTAVIPTIHSTFEEVSNSTT